MNIYRHNQPFELERGGILPELTIAFSTYGKLNAAHDNVIWVCHALTADSDVASWWPHTVEAGKFLDPAEHFIICANILGSHYGTTGPLHVNPATGRPYYKDFPELTIRDMVRAHRLLADILGIHRIHTLVGSSVGGFQAVEWAVQEPERIGKLVLIATAAKASPWSIAIDETQRMAIEADSTFGEPYATAGMKGLAAARAIGLLSYRGPEGYDLSQQDENDDFSSHRACTYQQYQGESSAGVTMPTPIIRSSTLSTRTTSATSAEAWQRRCNESRPNVWSSAFRPTSSSPCPKCRRCTGCCRAAPTTRSTPPSDTTGFWSSTNN